MIYQPLLDRCPHISTEGMNFDEWLDKRREAIGGSDAGAVMGMNPHSSPWMLYREKKNMVPKKEMGRAARRGKRLEPYIREETQTYFPELEIAQVPYMFTDPEYPFMAANIDGVILAKTPVEIRGQTIEGLGGHEIKSARTGYGWTGDEIPDAYYCQVQHYMRVTGLSWFLVSVCILDDDESLYHYVIFRDEIFITRLIEAEKNFWGNNVEKNVMPAPFGIDNEDDMITGEFEGVEGKITLGKEEIALCAEHVELNKTIKELEKRKDAIAVMLKDAIVNVGKVNPEKTEKPSEKKASAQAGNYSIKWSRYPRSSVDSDAIKRDGLYEKYKKTSESGRFEIKKGGIR